VARTRAPARRQRAERLSAADRREQLLDVAAKILLDSGFRALSMESVAERAGVSKGLGYAYFKNADDLAIALYDREVGEVYRRVEQAVERADSFEARIRASIRAYLNVGRERGAVIAILQARLQGRWFARSGRRTVGEFLGFWAKQLVTDLGVGREVAEPLAAAMLSATEAGVRAAIARRIPRSQVEETCVRFVLGGLDAWARPSGD
jgi:AcrR family transcriptional regulator